MIRQYIGVAAGMVLCFALLHVAGKAIENVAHGSVAGWTAPVDMISARP